MLGKERTLIEHIYMYTKICTERERERVGGRVGGGGWEGGRKRAGGRGAEREKGREGRTRDKQRMR